MTQISDLPLVGAVVVAVSSSSQLNLELQLETPADPAFDQLHRQAPAITSIIRIGRAFILHVSRDEPIRLVGDADGGDRSSLGVCLNLYGSTVANVTVSEEGVLHLEGLGGPVLERRPWTIDVPSDEHFEAWEIETFGQERRLTVAMPGGGLA